MSDSYERAAPRLTDRVDSVSRSAIRIMYDLAEDRPGEDLVRLEVGEPDFDTPEHVVDAAARAARAGDTHYTSNAGRLDLRRAIARKVERDHGVAPDPASELVVTTGAMEALHLALLTVAEPGSEVVVPSPVWPNYLTQAKLAGATPVEVPRSAEDGYALDANRVSDAISDGTAAVILNSPCNPTGRVYDPDAMERVVAAASRHGAFVIADEVYGGLTYEGERHSIAATTDHPEHVLTVNSFSKEYAMTGWRVGWLAGPADVVAGVTKIREGTTACTSSLSQVAAHAALTGPQEPVREMYDAFRERRDFVVDRIDDISGISCPAPEGAFYAFLDVSDLPGSSLDVAKRLLREEGVVVAPGGGFGEAGEGALRLSFANGLDRLELGLDRIGAFVGRELDADGA